jgi:hypothetical protein
MGIELCKINSDTTIPGEAKGRKLEKKERKKSNEN